MKRTIIIISSTLLVAFAGFIVWKSTCSKLCDYNNKMSVVCEYSCAAKDVDPSKVVAQSLAKIGNYTKCPISGVVFSITDESSKVNYKGKTAFICCATCSQLFDQSPAEYVSNIN